MNVDRYITDEALGVRPGRPASPFMRNVLRSVLRRVLPSILALHRADVLREAARRVMDESQADVEDDRIARATRNLIVSLLNVMANEAGGR